MSIGHQECQSHGRGMQSLSTQLGFARYISHVNPTSMHPTVLQVTQRIAQRSAAPRRAYLERMERLASRQRSAERLGCANVTHAFAALPGRARLRNVRGRAPDLAIGTAYNAMRSARQPYEQFPQWIRDEAHALGATAQVAGGVPAMCDGVTQGQPGMELSLFSRDTIAM